MVTLFSQQVDASQRPITLVASAVVHVGIIALITFGILYAPRVEVRPNDRYTVRHLDLRAPVLKPWRAAKGVVYPGGHPSARPGKTMQALAPLMETVHAQPGPQTLLQPDLAARLALKEQIPVPQILIWMQRKTVVKNIVAPPPHPPAASEAKPSLDAPNAEVTVSDVDIASSPVASQKLKILPTTSSPVVVHGLDQVQSAPSTVSQVSAQPTPAAVMSLSSLRMQGTATLPPVNESASAAQPGVLSSSMAASGNTPGAGSTSSAHQGTGPGNADGAAKPTAREGQPKGAAAGPTQGSDAGAGQDQANVTTEVTLPRNGSFGSVVVGDSLQDQYPELSGVWNGRMAYTVYLHVGLARSWILQYSLPQSAQITLDGNADRLEAPWPYSIVRPNLDAGAINADALMVHGFVNSAGHFEGLSIVSPAGFQQSQFVLDSLARWQFRPATDNGQIARIEVLLIIPEELD